MRKLLLIILFIPLFASARKFYVSSSTGNDANNGTSPATPWKTLTRVQTFGSSALAGDTISFKCGDVFANGSSGYNSMQWWGASRGANCASGTALNPIVFNSYGTGAKPNMLYPYPTATAGRDKLVLGFSGVEYITINGLQFNETRFSATDKVGATLTKTGIMLGEGISGIGYCNNCTVKNCDFSNIGTGIEAAGDYQIIDSNTITNLKNWGDTSGQNDGGAMPIARSNGKHCRITHNYIKGGWCFTGATASGEGLNGVGIEVLNDFDSSFVGYNTIIDCAGGFEIGSQYGSAYGANDDTFAYNKFINLGGLAYAATNPSGAFGGTIRRLRFWNNVYVQNQWSRLAGQRFGADIYGDGQSFAQFPSWGNGTGIPPGSYPYNSSRILGNYNIWSVLAYNYDTGVSTDTIYDSRNNVFWMTAGLQILRSNASTINLKRRNNIYHVAGADFFPSTLGAPGATLLTAELSTTAKLFIDSTNNFPEFWNYDLTSGSPAINTGTSVGLTKDFAGNPVSNIPSIGILEYTAAAVLPSVTTLAATSISYTTALIGGNITSDGGAPILRSGLMYSTIPLGTDTLSGIKVINPVLGTGVYTSPITGLTSSTTYYVRAFAVNNIGITFGANVSFITLTPPTLATVITSPATSITISAATLGGNVTLDGGASVTRRGIVYSTSVISDTNSITGGGRLASGTGTGVYTIPVTGLAINTLYHVRAFVVNSVGVYLASEVTFTTLNIPTLTTLAPTSITSSSAISGGNITSDGGSPVIRRGLVYNIIPISDTGINPKVIDLSGGTGSYTSLLSSLTPNTTYYILAFAVNANGVAYGNVLTFNTIVASIPTVTWAGVTLGVTTSVVNGNVTSEGSAPVTRRGFIYSLTTPLPADTNSGIKVIATGGGLGAFQATLTGLTALTIYYIRPFAVNLVGVSFGAETSFQTQGASSVTTTSPTAITATSATTGGVITDYGGTFVVERKLIYSTSPIVDTNSTVGGGILRYVPNTTAYPILLTSLLPNTTYYIAAFVVNALNFLTIGNQISFTTLQLLSIPTVTTNAVTSITPTSANVGGNVTSDGNSAVTRRGILYSTSPLGDTTTGTKIISGTVGTGSYTIPLSSLTSSTIYFARAFAVNAIGVSYGDNVQFVTSPALSFPTVSTNVATAIGVTTATSGGNVVNDGNTTVFRRGLIYSTSAITDTNSVTGGGRIISGTTGTGTYTSSLTGLTGNTLYYIAAFAVNSIGVRIANQITFTTLPAPTAPLVTTLPATFITISTAVIGGNVTSDGNSTVTRRGLIYSTVSPISDTNSIVGGKLIISGSGLGTYNASLSSLTSNTTYYVKAFALNSVGITYGNEVNFATPVFTPRFSSFRVRKKYIQKP
jgi:hypothetical protein